MFAQLFGSKTRVKLLSLFLNNPGRSYYVREITRRVDEQINSVRRELSNLLSIGIIKSDSQNNRLYYEANTNYEFYEPLRAVFSQIPITTKEIKDTKEEEQIAKKLKTTGSIQLAFLTGAFVRDSRVNIDLFVVGDVNRIKFGNVVSELEKDMSRELNYTIMTPDDYNYRLSLNDRFLSNVMEARKLVLISGDDEPLQHEVLPVDGDAVPVAVEVNSE